MKVIIVYKTDNWHSYNSRDMISIVNTKKEAVKICKLKAKKEKENFGLDQVRQLEDLWQTQNYEGSGEFQIVQYDKNTLL
jgi:hypothetical protein